MQNALDWYIDNVLEPYEDISSVKNWPRWLRRIFLLTFPISIPLWCATWGIVIVFGFIPMIIAIIQFMFEEWWK